MFEDPRLAAQAQQQNPADVWQPKTPGSTPWTTNSGPGAGYSRVTIQDGQAVSTQSAGPTIASTKHVNEEQNAAARVPFDYAIDPQTRCRLSPHEVKEDSIIFVHGSSMSLAQARNAQFIPADWRPGGTYSAPQSQEGRENNKRFYDASAEQPKQEVHPELAAEAFQNKDAEQTLDTIVTHTGGFEQM